MIQNPIKIANLSSLVGAFQNHDTDIKRMLQNKEQIEIAKRLLSDTITNQGIECNELDTIETICNKISLLIPHKFRPIGHTIITISTYTQSGIVATPLQQFDPDICDYNATTNGITFKKRCSCSWFLRVVKAYTDGANNEHIVGAYFMKNGASFGGVTTKEGIELNSGNIQFEIGDSFYVQDYGNTSWGSAKCGYVKLSEIVEID